MTDCGPVAQRGRGSSRRDRGPEGDRAAPAGEATFLLDGQRRRLPPRRDHLAGGAPRRALHPAPLLAPWISGRTAPAAFALSRSTVARRRPARSRRPPGLEVESQTEELQRRAQDPAADAVRRGQSLLSVLREERQLPAAGHRPTRWTWRARTSRSSIRTGRSMRAIRTSCSTSTAASSAVCACAPAERSMARASLPSAATASARHLLVNSASGRLGDTDLTRPTAPPSICPVGAILPKRRGFAVPIGERRFDIKSVVRAGQPGGVVTMTSASTGRAAAAQAQGGHGFAGRLLRLPHVVPGHRRAPTRADRAHRVRPFAADRHQDGSAIATSASSRAACATRKTCTCCARFARIARRWWRWAPARSTAACPRSATTWTWASCSATIYQRQPGSSAGSAIPNDPELPLPLNQVRPIHEVVHVDYFLPGCPPSADAFWSFLNDLMAGRTPHLGHGLIHYD